MFDTTFTSNQKEIKYSLHLKKKMKIYSSLEFTDEQLIQTHNSLFLNFSMRKKKKNKIEIKFN